MNVGILGAGGVGGFLAAQLVRSGVDVICVGSEPSVVAIRKHGIALTSAAKGDVHVRPRAVTFLDEPVDMLFVTVKAPFLQAALERISVEAIGSALVIPLLNGIEHVAICRTRLLTKVAAATISVEAFVEAPGRITHASPHAKIELATDDPSTLGKLYEVEWLLKGADLDARIGSSETQTLWNKLARLNALAITTAAFRQPLGMVRRGHRVTLIAALKEGIDVACAEGAHLLIDEQMAFVDGLPDGLKTSLQRDIEESRPSELDAIAGAVVRAGERHGFGCETIRSLIQVISSG